MVDEKILAQLKWWAQGGRKVVVQLRPWHVIRSRGRQVWSGD